MNTPPNKVETRFIMRPSDVMLIFNLTYEPARKRLKAIKDALNKKHITFIQFAQYEDLDYHKICEICNVRT